MQLPGAPAHSGVEGQARTISEPVSDRGVEPALALALVALAVLGMAFLVSSGLVAMRVRQRSAPSASG